MRPLALLPLALSLGACSAAAPPERPSPRESLSAANATSPATPPLPPEAAVVPAGSTPSPRLAGPQVQIPAGPVELGCQAPFRLCDGARGSQRRSVDAFFIDAGPVTRRAYGACVAAGRCPALGPVSGPEGETRSAHCAEPLTTRPTEPVACVNLVEAEQYCAWLHRRLPGEAEWQRAAEVAAAGATGGLLGFGAGLELVRGRFALSDDAEAGPLALLFPSPERWSVVRGSYAGAEPSLRLPFEGRSESVGFRCARSLASPEPPGEVAEPARLPSPQEVFFSAGALALAHHQGRCRVAAHWVLPGGRLRATCEVREERDGQRGLHVAYLRVEDGSLVAGTRVGSSGAFGLLAPLEGATPLFPFRLEVDESEVPGERPALPQRALGEGLVVTFREPVLRVTNTRGGVVLQRSYPAWDRLDWSSEDADCRGASNLTWMLEGVTGSRGAGLLLISLAGWGSGLCAHAEHVVRLPP